MVRFGLLLLLSFTVLSCKEKNEHDIADSGVKKPVITMVVTPSSYGGYGYDIFLDNNLIVHQPHIPVVAGTWGFKTKESASKVAALVIEKIKRNELPPALTIEDLQRLEIGL